MRKGASNPVLHEGEVRAYNNEKSDITIWLLVENGALQIEEYGSSLSIDNYAEADKAYDAVNVPCNENQTRKTLICLWRAAYLLN